MHERQRKKSLHISELSINQLKYYLWRLAGNTETKTGRTVTINDMDEQNSSQWLHPPVRGMSFNALINAAYNNFEHRNNPDGSITFFLNRPLKKAA